MIYSSSLLVSMICLKLSDIDKNFDGNHAVNNVSFDIKPHTVNLLIGANGSGKTTLINCISGFFQSYNGHCFFNDQDITHNKPEQNFKESIIRTFQTPKLFESLSVIENLLVTRSNAGEVFQWCLFYSKWKNTESVAKEKALSILESLNMLHLKDNLAYNLSGGQIKLLELAKILMLNPKLVLLDEPIAGIHPDLANKIFEKIVEIAKTQGTTFLIVEHKLDIALKYANYCFVLSEGRLIAQDFPDKILQNSKVIESYLK